MQNPTTVKRAVIIVTFIFILCAIALVIYLVVSSPATCSDGKQNQSEKGIDCGGVCSPCITIKAVELLAQETAVVMGGNNTFDAVAKINNPNDSLGARFFNYSFILKDAAGNIVATKTGNSFILPLDTKYLAEIGIKTENNTVPTSAEISFSELDWAPLGETEKPQLGVYNKKFGKAPMGEGSEVQGLLRNDSNYDLDRIELVIILRGADDKILGVNVTEKNVVRSSEQRDFRINWPYALPGNVQKMEIDAQSNVLDPQNFTMTR